MLSPGAAARTISTSSGMSAQSSSARRGSALRHCFQRSEMLQTSTTNYEWARKKAKLTRFPVSLPQQEQQDHITYKRSLETQITLRFSALPNFIISASSKPTGQELKILRFYSLQASDIRAESLNMCSLKVLKLVALGHVYTAGLPSSLGYR